MKKTLEETFEGMLWNTRFIIIIAVFGLLIGSFVAFWLGIESLLFAIGEVWNHGTANEVLVHLISAIDEFLLGIVMIIMALGVYELFISEIDGKKGQQYPQWLQFHSLEELKAVLTKVIIIILIVYFFKSVVVMKFDTPVGILYLGAGIILVALADYLTKKTKIHDHK